MDPQRSSRLLLLTHWLPAQWIGQLPSEKQEAGQLQERTVVLPKA